MNDETDEQWTIYSIIEYISQNFFGLTLLFFAFLIIYFVDYINNLNSIILSPQIPTAIKIKSKNFKKH